MYIPDILVHMQVDGSSSREKGLTHTVHIYICYAHSGQRRTKQQGFKETLQREQLCNMI